MTTKKKQFKAHLIKYKTDEEGALWFWVNPNSSTRLSPYFDSQEDAEKWFDDVLIIHNETYDLIDRVKNGQFFTIKGRIDVGDVISSVKSGECPFTIHLDDDIIEVQVLATSKKEAKNRVEQYFEILEWIDDV